MNMEINPIQPSVSESTRDVILDLLHGPFGPFSSRSQSEMACGQQALARAACPNI